MQYPFENKKARKITSPFGMRVHPITKEKKMHNGADMVDKAGTPIVAPEKALVLEARKSTAAGGGYGYYVKLKGASGTVHILAHMIEGSLAVKKGQRIQQGTQVGQMGTTGASTGVHLHWETHVNGKPVDPISLVEPKPADNTKAWTKRDGDVVRAYIKEAPTGIKVRVRQNGESVFNKTIKTQADKSLTKTIELVDGKNRIEIEVDGEIVKAATYTKRKAVFGQRVFAK